MIARGWLKPSASELGIAGLMVSDAQHQRCDIGMIGKVSSIPPKTLGSLRCVGDKGVELCLHRGALGFGRHVSALLVQLRPVRPRPAPHHRRTPGFAGLALDFALLSGGAGELGGGHALRHEKAR